MSDKATLLEITDDNFESSVEESSGLTMIDFWAVWCGPCRIIAPIVEQLADEYEDVRVGKLDVDNNPKTAARFGVRSIPSILFFKDGELVDTVVGAVPKPTLEEKIQQHM